MDLPIDIFFIIIDFLPICDTRNLLRCCKKLHGLSSNKVISSIINISSLDRENKLNFELLLKWHPKISKISFFANHFKMHFHIKREKLSEMKKYTFENICHGYIHLILNKYIKYIYIINDNGLICINAGYNHFLALIKFA